MAKKNSVSRRKQRHEHELALHREREAKKAPKAALPNVEGEHVAHSATRDVSMKADRQVHMLSRRDYKQRRRMERLEKYKPAVVHKGQWSNSKVKARVNEKAKAIKKENRRISGISTTDVDMA